MGESFKVPPSLNIPGAPTSTSRKRYWLSAKAIRTMEWVPWKQCIREDLDEVPILSGRGQVRRCSGCDVRLLVAGATGTAAGAVEASGNGTGGSGMRLHFWVFFAFFRDFAVGGAAGALRRKPAGAPSVPKA
ncbi:hypothetical protein HPB50_008675 [Hyalomma asiaticum]|uniref:Uncharacterized protein n=1 Tax=Hyalomma asiaticum TaxID=266040 RepID=A0ACB7SPP1_HYAAI|nr:hypothetical protein HPB50_008675 [Hyalomma asiaticum]